MSCTIKDFKERKLTEAIDLIYNDKAVTYSKDKNSVIITPSNKSDHIKTMDQAYRAGESMLKKLENKFGKDYMFNVFGHWGTIFRGPNSVRVEVNIPANLVKAYEKREAHTRNVDYFNSDTALYEQEQREMEYFFDLPAKSTDPLNFSAYSDYKKELLKRLDKAILSMKSLSRVNKSKELSRRIREAEAKKTLLQQEIQTLYDSDTIFEQMMAFINQDLNTIDQLLDNNNIDNLHTAERMIGFYKTISNYVKGSPNPLVDTQSIYDSKGRLHLDPSIKDALDTLATVIGEKESKLKANKESYLQGLIDSSSHIQSLFPDMDIQELLKDIKDIDIASQFFLTIDKQFITQDSLLSQLMRIELERSRTNKKAFVAKIKERMNAILPAVKKKLPRVASIPYWFGKSITESDFSIFYQQTDKGNKTGKLVERFSAKWNRVHGAAMKSFNSAYYTAIAKKRWADKDKALIEKYDWLARHTDFFDITNVPEIVNDPRYQSYLEGVDTSKADLYKQNFIKRYGEVYYNEVLNEQLEQLESFEDWLEDYVEYQLQENNVSTFADLPEAIRFNLQITALRNNPFDLIKSHKSGDKGMITVGENQYASELKYLQYMPKETLASWDINTNTPVQTKSGYFDDNFKAIEEDSDLYEFWKILYEATSYINNTLADSEKQLRHGSILSMKKSFWDILIDPDSGIGNMFISLSSELRSGLKNAFTSNSGTKSADDFDDITKAQFKTNEEQISQRRKRIELKMKRLFGDGALTSIIKTSDVSQQVMDELNKEFGLPNNRAELSTILGKRIVLKDVINEYVTDQVVQEQTFNLPVIIRAYLEMTAEYHAQKESMPILSIFKQFYESIKRENSNSKVSNTLLMKAFESTFIGKGIKGERVKANTRLNHWYNKNVKGLNDTADWINLGKRISWISYDKEEAKLKAELEARLNNPETTDEERVKIAIEIENLGANMTLAAIYNSVINRFTIWKGLAYSLRSNLTNRFQGVFQTMVYDTGRYWTPGNGDASMEFIMKKGLRYVPGHNRYKEEIDKVKLLINDLNIIQDATNEIDRARNESGLTGITKKVQPFYITEYTEWHNQVPQILAVLMDKRIKDKDGNEVAVFTGKELPAHEIRDGILKLKPEFAEVPGNIETWEKFSSVEAADNKIFISEMIANINGDYSRTGSTYIKGGNIGKTIMLFKTWMPNNIWNRIARKQPNLAIGKKEISGVYNSHRPYTLGTMMAAGGFLAGGLPIAAMMYGAGAITGAVINKSNGRESIRYDAEALSQMATVAQAILRKMIGLPINGISALTTGKKLVKDHSLGNMDITEQDKENLRSIISEISVLLSFMLFKILIKGLLGDHDDDEPKTVMNEKAQNPFYPGNPRSEREKIAHNVLENQITGFIEDISLYTDPNAMYNSVVKRNTLFRTLENITKLKDAIAKWNLGEDRLKTGPDRGESRLWKQIKRMLLPSMIESPFTLGFESSMEQEYNNREYIDSFFDSDYKSDRKKARADRSEERERLTKEFRRDFEYDNLDSQEKIIIDDIIKTQVNKILESNSPYPERMLYDEKQKRIE